MIGRALGIAVALGVTLIGVMIAVALIVHDFFGSDTLAKAWEGARSASRARVELSELDRARGFSFFTMEPVKGHDFEVTTGVRFEKIADLLAGRQESRWCYAAVRPKGGGVTRQINLARQTGIAMPVFDDLSAYPESEMRDLGVSAKTLEGIGRAKCRFRTPDGRTATIDEYEAAAAKVRSA